MFASYIKSRFHLTFKFGEIINLTKFYALKSVFADLSASCDVCFRWQKVGVKKENMGGLHIVFVFIVAILFTICIVTLKSYHCFLVARNKSTVGRSFISLENGRFTFCRSDLIICCQKSTDSIRYYGPLQFNGKVGQ